jgi:hypothetical protein
MHVCVGIASRWLVDAADEEDEEGIGAGAKRRGAAGGGDDHPSTSSPGGSAEAGEPLPSCLYFAFELMFGQKVW